MDIAKEAFKGNLGKMRTLVMFVNVLGIVLGLAAGNLLAAGWAFNALLFYMFYIETDIRHTRLLDEYLDFMKTLNKDLDEINKK